MTPVLGTPRNRKVTLGDGITASKNEERKKSTVGLDNSNNIEGKINSILLSRGVAKVGLDIPRRPVQTDGDGVPAGMRGSWDAGGASWEKKWRRNAVQHASARRTSPRERFHRAGI